MTANTTGKQRGRPFKKGQSGNPKGKPKGRRHNTTMAAQSLLDGEAQKLTRKAVEMALAGDGLALKLCLDRILPVRKDRPVQLVRSASKVKTAEDSVRVMGKVVEAVSVGRLTPCEGQAIGEVLAIFCKALEARDIEARLQRLEGMVRDDPDAPAAKG